MSRAVEKGDERVVKLLLESGAQPDFEDEKGWTPLLRAIEQGSVAIMQRLLAKGVKMDFKYIVVSEHHPHLIKSPLD